ncbi:hypothetical protein CLF_101879 [Clonorchis sinensis]|uniref:Uncharacterized protein n=1 Tax=Clonorchis sinensis TaxID=79923 RepID=G7Y6S1_CLOSI|nr:hypothetical protein CLF_101879 [Clonorchis sinensis]
MTQSLSEQDWYIFNGLLLYRMRNPLIVAWRSYVYLLKLQMLFHKRWLKRINGWTFTGTKTFCSLAPFIW